MGTSTRSSMVRTALALGLLWVSAGPAHAQGIGGRLAGTWNIALTIRNCATGDALVTIQELATFNSGGTMVSSTAGFSQATKTPGHGVPGSSPLLQNEVRTQLHLASTVDREKLDYRTHA